MAISSAGPAAGLRWGQEERGGFLQFGWEREAAVAIADDMQQAVAVDGDDAEVAGMSSMRRRT